MLRCFYLHILQEPIYRNEQLATAFWNCISHHFDGSTPCGSLVHPARSLETKWRNIKHDVSKFCGAYRAVLDCRGLGTLLKDARILQRSASKAAVISVFALLVSTQRHI